LRSAFGVICGEKDSNRKDRGEKPLGRKVSSGILALFPVIAIN